MANSLSIKDRIEQGEVVLLCIAALTFPFSVAACNIALGTCLIIGLLNGDYIAGLRHVWQHHRSLSIAWMAYLALFPIGLLWSLDVDRGLQIIGRQWFWLLTPLVIQLLGSTDRRRLFFLALSAGLSLHLVFCVAQFYGLVTLIGKGGSTATNPTGFIGHTSFGLVYGIWAAFLVHWSLFLNGWQRWTTRLLALWAVGMIFLSSGRGGYLVVAVLLLVMLWKLVRVRPLLKLGAASLAILAMAALLTIGPGKERIISSWNSFQAMEKGNFRNPEARWSLWYAAILGWQQHMPLGVGTGGYHVAADVIKEQHPDLFYGGLGSSPAHPHNMLLQALTRWGPLGMLLLAALFFLWIREGWRCDWHSGPASGLIALTGIALFVQGLTEPSFEEHFPGILAVMLLGAGLAARQATTVPSD
ncbi:MAG: hypothetical protein COW19_08830 [Zetaproteobacteria bacterium CG12_big_fil_rev_8_21_14_0_65_55_1124]|nr:MAG: hypothetical protein AUJ58_03115 [Zetaproteobacteria bacterium CG1_02_55_237]PIS19463.1 MAG: hypothetical protein COT53_05435 [Zetaproteobacteria bacterium CG08_land_8_20_14_0_20_55_17]PIW42294.1 MAG: hypothetical protein COW19_08830 [Zetaproteobacteria bacterium CG12_big_fil_rev_8_21_14_0_65_55_1124]PIY52531.1 MAG: hypothetical protein COZ01_07305 [Zetaproteobacteria bacterium CG_4_10_14_0_8_um_filter_55_43]PIZ36905.1 MAG: hypothetical protein COY36_10715 [Zetaproteobacteria bacterium 